jgi:saccharopine dehydrogenase-like NADP-dependent oxidoreductase
MLDAFCQLLQGKLSYLDSEVDMIALQHKFTIKSAAGEKHLSSTLIVEGDAGGFSAMAKTVGYPVAIATELLLDRTITERGVVIPVNAEIYNPVLAKLESEGIVCQERAVDNIDEPFFQA